jgi:phosphoribosylformimino-5-aminoimidazole carboxamide ribotide isomerase
VIVIPAIDLRDGACVQLVGGSYARERIRRDDPLAVARDFHARGFTHLHIVDLDAALGLGSNAGLVARLTAETGAEVQVGGGVRDAADIARLLAAGARRVIVGTRAIEEPDWLEAQARAFPGVLVVAADARDRHVVTRGWTHVVDLDVCDLVSDLARLPLAGVLVTAVHREGRLEGVDLSLTRDVTSRTTLPVHVAGGIHSLEDLRALDHAGVHAAIVGMAFYTGTLDPAQVIAEFASPEPSS